MTGFVSFPRYISPKVNMIARLEFELAYFEVAVQYFIHYTTGDSLLQIKYSNFATRIKMWCLKSEYMAIELLLFINSMWKILNLICVVFSNI